MCVFTLPHLHRDERLVKANRMLGQLVAAFPEMDWDWRNKLEDSFNGEAGFNVFFLGSLGREVVLKTLLDLLKRNQFESLENALRKMTSISYSDRLPILSALIPFWRECSSKQLPATLTKTIYLLPNYRPGQSGEFLDDLLYYDTQNRNTSLLRYFWTYSVLSPQDVIDAILKENCIINR